MPARRWVSRRPTACSRRRGSSAGIAAGDDRLLHPRRGRKSCVHGHGPLATAVAPVRIAARQDLARGVDADDVRTWWMDRQRLSVAATCCLSTPGGAWPGCQPDSLPSPVSRGRLLDTRTKTPTASVAVRRTTVDLRDDRRIDVFLGDGVAITGQATCTSGALRRSLHVTARELASQRLGALLGERTLGAGESWTLEVR
jgi:hypothetical protein